MKQDNLSISNSNAFTLIELILYIGIASILLVTISSFLFILLESRVKNQTIAEVEQQGIQAMQIITQTIRDAEGVNSPTQGTSGSTLSLDVITAGNDPTVFDLSSNTLQITEGSGGAVSITNSRIIVSDLTFRNLSYSNAQGAIKIEFTLTHINPEGRQEYGYSKTFYGSASIRK
ncbi:hypothetical protein HOD96_03410 [Candidatus Falkowbacteria bacterium]|jgi:Tfp pilus assembly protein PilW|nr:hypothetical protein [Candidatus Falkowbacteria bacterium]MBT4432976.1 hypothetical protein [Candidatus Falkowbacteria bacterium]